METAGVGVSRERRGGRHRASVGKEKKRQVGPPRAANFTPRSISPNGAEWCASGEGSACNFAARAPG